MTTVLSASSVGSYETCRLQWYFTYVEARETPPSEAQAVGIAVHDWAEKVLRGDTENPPPVDPVLDPLMLVFHRDIHPTYGTPVLIEEPFQITVNGIPFSGVIDALDYDDSCDVYTLRDLKTTGKRPSAGKYRFNMTGYYIGVTQGLDKPVDLMTLDYIVRTQKPYYWPEAVLLPDEDEMDAWAASLERVAESIEQGNYQPTGLGTWACGYCPHSKSAGRSPATSSRPVQ